MMPNFINLLSKFSNRYKAIYLFWFLLNFVVMEDDKSKYQGNSNSIVSNEEIIVSNMLQIEAIVRVLEQKNIATADEILDEVKKLKVEMEERIKKNSREN